LVSKTGSFFNYSSKVGVSDTLEIGVKREFCDSFMWNFGTCFLAVAVYGKKIPSA